MVSDHHFLHLYHYSMHHLSSLFNIQCSTFKGDHCFDQMLKTGLVHRIPFEQVSMLHKNRSIIREWKNYYVRKTPRVCSAAKPKLWSYTCACIFFSFLFLLVKTKLLLFRSTHLGHSSLCFLFLSWESLSIALLKTYATVCYKKHL